jgi:hypothetical protein
MLNIWENPEFSIGIFVILRSSPRQMMDKDKGKYIQQAVEASMVVSRRGSHIFETIGPQMAVRLSALRADHRLTPGRFLVLIYVKLLS